MSYTSKYVCGVIILPDARLVIQSPGGRYNETSSRSIIGVESYLIEGEDPLAALVTELKFTFGLGDSAVDELKSVFDYKIEFGIGTVANTLNRLLEVKILKIDQMTTFRVKCKTSIAFMSISELENAVKNNDLVLGPSSGRIMAGLKNLFDNDIGKIRSK